jgi:replication fork clamp-binding protein CrfC
MDEKEYKIFVAKKLERANNLSRLFIDENGSLLAAIENLLEELKNQAMTHCVSLIGNENQRNVESGIFQSASSFIELIKSEINWASDLAKAESENPKEDEEN